MRTNHVAVSLFLMSLASIIVFSSIPTPVRAVTSGFTFDAAGDYADNSATTTVWQGMGSSGANFALSLGDMLYCNSNFSSCSSGTCSSGSSCSEQQWCQTFKSSISNVEIAVGNHETFESNASGTGGGSINKFIQYCPYTLGTVGGGAYGFQYFFDYPQPNPLARFIVVDPSIWNGTTSSSSLDYRNGTTNQMWVGARIDDARTNNIPWVIVAFHKPCISTGTEECGTQQDFLRFLLSKKIDLILNGHDHNYERSKQLVCATAELYVPSCVSNDGSSGIYTKGAGSVLVVSGAGGAGNVPIDTTDPDYPYWATTNSAAPSVKGFAKFNVTSTAISEQWVTTSSGPYSDSFTINSPNTGLTGGFTFTPPAPSVGQTITFTATASGGTSPYTFSWNFGDTGTGTGSPVTHAYSAKGNYTATLSIRDFVGATVTVSNTVPVGMSLQGSFTFTPTAPSVSQTVTFTATALGGTSPYTFSWNYGDSATATGNPVTHSYSAKGTYTATLTIHDSATATLTVSNTIQVGPSALQGSFTTTSNSPAFDYVVTVVMENNGYCDVITTCPTGQRAGPYETSLAQNYTIAGSCQSDSSCSIGGYTATSHPSAGNYITLLAGSDFGHVTDGFCTSPPASPCYSITQPNIIDRIESIGKTWQAWAEDASNNATCSFNPPRQADHFGFLTFSDLNTFSRCSHFLSTSSSSDSEFLAALNSPSPANYLWLTPIDSHSTGLPGGDNYLSGLVPKILSSSLFRTKNAALFIVYDEGNSGCSPGSGCGGSMNDFIYASWSGPVVKNRYVGTGSYSHFSYSKTLETVWGLGSLGTNDTNARAMTEFFPFTAGSTITFASTITGGTSPYTVNWDFGDGAPPVTGVNPTHTYAAKGTYMVRMNVTDANGASVTTTGSVTVRPQTLTTSVNCGTATTGKPVTCNASATGGTSPYTFAWSAPGGSPAAGTSASFTTTYTTKGTFLVNATATDANGAKKSVTTSVVVAAQPIVVTVTCGTAIAGKPVTCNASATGGAAPYTFSWSAPTGTPSAGTGASFTTTYSTKGGKTVNATATDANSVKKFGLATINVGGQPIVVTVTCVSTTAGKPATCNASAAGGTSPYTFSWSAPGGNPATGTGSSFTTTYATKGTFNVNATATDANNVKMFATASIVVAAQAIVVTVNCGSATVGKPVTCNASATGGTGPYTFSWSAPGGTPATGTGASLTTAYANKGTFVVNATATDGNGAKRSATASVIVAPQPLVVTVTCGSATVGKPVTCNASATGGTGPYTFSWSALGGNPTTGTGAGFTATYATKGTFVVNATATDFNNSHKSQTTSVVITGQSIIVIVTCGTAIAGKPVTCNASATGGTPPYTFTWASKGTPATGTGSSYTTTFAVKGPQVVNATARDNNAATKLGQATVNVAAQPIVVTITCVSTTAGKPVTCNASATGGTAPYTFAWSATGSSPATGSGTSFTTTYPTKGTFVVNATTTDGNGVKKSVTANIVVAAQQIVVTVSCGSATAGKAVTCNASATGGTTPYTFSWSAQGGSPSTGTGASLTTTYATKGTFIVNATATDNNGVKRSQTANILLTAQPIVVTINCGPATAGNPVTCNVTATGGTAPYTFTWSAPGGNPATGSGSNFIVTYPAKGTFVVKANATDGNNVRKSTTANVVVAAPPISFHIADTPGLTVGKPVSFTSTTSGGTPPYTVTWNFGDGSPIGTGQTISHTYAAKGTYTVVANVTDANGVKTSSTIQVTISSQPLIALVSCTPATAGKPLTCNASATDGSPPYTFSWSAPGGSPSTGLGASFTTTYAAKGTFVVNATATDINNAKKSQTASVVVAAQPIVVTVTCGTATAGKPVTCNASATGGTAPYTFSWSALSGSPATGTGASFTTTYATKGTNVVNATATDTNGVKKSGTATVAVAGQQIVVTATCGTATAGKPATCNASATGGTGPYTFTWASKGNPATGTGSSYTTTFATKGTQVVNATARDANMVTKLGQATVNVAAQPMVVTIMCGAATAGKPVTCNASATGGTSPYTFSWSAPGGSPTIGTGPSITETYASKGTFVVNATATDINNVKKTQTSSVVVAGQPIVNTVTCGSATVGKPVTCNASATGGTSPYTFTWASKGSPATGTGSSYTITFASKGSQTINATATDINSVSNLGQATIIVAGQPIVVTVACGTATAGKPVTCNASASGGTGPYTFTWASKGTPASGTGPSYTTTFAAKGSQTINATAKDLNGVSKLGQAIITVAGQPIVVTVTCGTATAGKPVTCNASATGGTSAYTFSWSSKGSPATGTGSSYTTTFASKGPQTVNATATDLNGVSALGQAIVSVTAQPIVVTVACGSATAGKPVTCSASATGGTSPYTFAWASKGSPATGTGPSYTTTFASKGSQVVNATATDVNMVSRLGQATINVAAQPIVVTVSCGTATAGKPVTCNASASGGTGPYTFSWSAPGASAATGTGASFTTTYPAKGADVVNATATDLNGVRKSQTASITVAPQPLQAVIQVTCASQLAAATAGKPITCNGFATGGTPPYTFAWNTPGGTPASGTSASFTVSYATKGSFTFRENVTDINGQKATTTAPFVVAAQPIVVTVTCGTATAGKPVTCNVSATGGTSPFTFSWYAPGGSPATGTGTGFTTTYATKGTDVVNATATDLNGVKKSQTASIVVAGQPIVVTVSCGTATAGKPVTCNVSAMGGTGPFTFSWSAPGGTLVTGAGASFTTTYPTKGTFVVNATATDNNGAKKSQTASIVVTGQPIVITVTCGAATAGKPVTCNASTTGGTAPFTFSWSAPGGNPSTGSGVSFTTIYAAKGTFVVNATASDNNGAKKSQTASIVVTGQALVVTVTCGTATVGKPVTCNASATGGTAPFTFSWSAPGGTQSTSSGSSFVTTYPTKGTFVVNATATDNNGAKAFKTASVVVGGQPIVVTVTCGTATVGKPVTCNVSATGGTAPYTFTWSAPGGNPSTGFGTSFTTTYAAKGTFVVNATATDNNGAKAFKTASIVVGGQPIVVTVTCGTATVGKPVTCSVAVSGGTPPYTGTFSAPGGSPASGSLNAAFQFTTTYPTKGTFVVNATVTDNNGAKSFKTASIVVRGQPIVVMVSCATATVGKPVTCSAAATGGTPPYAFSWSAPGGNPATGTGVSFTTTYAAKGTFVVNATATDNNGAKSFKTASIVVGGQPIVVTVSCGTATVGKPVTCNAAATGGTAPFTFSWSAPGGTPATGTGASFTTTYSAKGTFVVNATATDNNGAKKSQTASIVVDGQPIVVTVTCGSATAGKRVTCNASAMGGTTPFIFSWSAPGGTPATGTGVSFTTTYATKGTDVVNATATDGNGAKKSTTTSVVVAAQPIIVTVTCGTATAGKPVACNASATGGTAPYTFTWSSKGTPATGTGPSYTTTFASKGSQVLNATVMDANNVGKLGQATVNVVAQPIVVTVTCGTTTAGKPVTCNASATGGTAPYLFTWASKGSPGTGTVSSYTTTFASKGPQTVNATATDTNNLSKLGQATVTVAGQPIVVTVTCGTATAGKPVACNASATGGTPPYTFTWASKGSPAAGTGSSYATTFASKGSQTVNATAQDGNAVTKLGQTTINVVAQPVAVTVTCGSATPGKPVTCRASATGGTAPYTFSWSAPGSSLVTGTGANFTTTYAVKGTYPVNANVTDANHVSRSASTNIVVVAQPLTVTETCGTFTIGQPGTCSATVSGGTSPYTYQWNVDGANVTSSAQPTFTTAFPAKGPHTIKVFAVDSNRASQTATKTITVQGTSPVSTITCGNATSGKSVTCSASVSGGTSPYIISWASQGNPATGTGLSYATAFATKGSYSVNATVTDANGASASGSTAVTVAPQQLAVSVTCGTATAGKPITCNASATGGTAAYTFAWSAPSGSPATGTGASFTTTYATKGTFVVNATATDLNGAKKSQTASIVVTGQPIVVTITCGSATAGKPVTCNASAAGGTAPFTFSWSAPGGSPATGTGSSFTTTYAAKGTFVVNATATDNNGAKAFKTASIVVGGQPIVVTVSCGTATVGKPVTCNASATGGTAPYTFTWSAPGGNPSTGSGTSFTTTYAAKGTFVVNATATDNNGAKAFKKASVVVTGQPIVVTVNCGTATVGKPVTCNASATGGTAPFTFSWSAPGGSPATGTGSSFMTTYPTKGTFVVNATATDNNGAKSFKTASVVVGGQPIVVTVTCGTATVGKPVTCNASATGGTAPYTFTWSAPGGNPATGTGPSFTTTYSAKGTFVVNATATDNNGAKKSQTPSIVVTGQPIIVTVTCGSTTAGKPVACNASASGGTAPYGFTWSSKGTPATGTGPSYTTTFASKGSLMVNATAMDANNVSKLGQATVNVVAQPIVVTVTCGTATAGKSVTCNASATSGTAPYTFTWSAPGGSPATGTGASFTTTYATKGTFVVNATETDFNNAKKSQTARIVVAGQPIIEPVICGSATAGKPVTCNASATGGTPPYTFSWSAPGGTPATGTGPSFTTTYATKGTFVVNATATDLNGAKKSQTASIVVSGQPIIVTVTCGTATAGKPVSCSATASGGTAPYTFTWASNGTPATGTGPSYTTTFASKGSQIVNATAKDTNNVNKLGQAPVNVVGQPIVVTVTCGTATAGKPVTCNASATGGTSPYTLSWSAPSGSPATGAGTSFTTTYAAKGTFVVNDTATDNNGAKSFKTASIVVTSQPIVVMVTCGNATAGKPVACNASATGGTSPFTFSWSAPGGSPATGTGASFATTYATKGIDVVNATATDNNGAKSFRTASIVVAAQPFQVTISTACVNAVATATAGKPINCSATASGGTSPYTFKWTAVGGTPPSGTGSTFTVSYAVKGTYTLTVNATDANNRFAVQSVTNFVVAPQPIVVTVTCGSATTGKPVTCNALASGGTSPYTFSWSAPGGSPATGTGASFTTTYATKGIFVANATATDNNGAKKSQTASVVVTGQAIVVTVTCGAATSGKPVTCNGSATGGTAPFTFSWSAPGGSPATGTGASFTTTYATKGTFVVNATATDNNGAKKSQTASIVVTGQAIVVTVTCGTATSGKPVTCNASATGGTAPFTFSWSAPGGSPATGTGASFTTTYATKGTTVVNATATDNNGAKKSQTASIVVAAQPLQVSISALCMNALTTVAAGKPISCSAAASGGTAPYTFTWTAVGGTPASGTGPTFTVSYAVKGTYTLKVNVTDANNRFAVQSVTNFVVAPQPIVVTVTCGSATVGKPVTCNASATGGTAPFTFSWSAPGGSPATGTGASFTTTYAAKGTFVVNATVTDNNGAKAFKTASIVVRGQPIVVMVSCATATVGKPVACNASATGGTAPFTFSWSAPGGNPSTGSGASFTTTYPAKGTFVVNATVTDNNGAKSFKTASIVVIGQPIVVTVTCGTATSGKPVTCNVSAVGGTGPYTFSWGSTGTPATGTGSSYTSTFASKGLQTVNATAKDGNAVTKLGQVAVNVAGQPIIVTITCGSATVGKPVTCNAIATGGTAPYMFAWSAAGGTSATGVGTSFTATFATKGTFVVNATATDTNAVKKFVLANIVVTAQPIAISISQSPTTATTGKPVTFTATVSGGTSPYTFQWSTDGAKVSGATASTFTTTFSTGGSHSVAVNVTDVNSILKVQTLTLTVQPQNLVITANCPGGSTGKPLTCTSVVTGGTAPYTVTWTSTGTPASFTATGSKVNYTVTFATKNAAGLPVNATVVDSTSPTRLRSSTLVKAIITAQPITVTVTCGSATAGKPVTCNASATGGTTPSTFTWASKGSPATGTGSSYTTNFASKGSQTINATATDANSVSKLGQATVNVAAQPMVVTIACGSATAGKPVTCNASATGGTPPFTFTWSAPGGSPATGTSASFTITYAAKGTFVVNATATDLNGSMKSQTASIVVTGQPSVVTVTCPSASAGKPVTCNASATGGTGPYTFTWASRGTPATGTGASYTTTFATKGSQVVNATAKDLNNFSKLGQATVNVVAQPIVVIVTCGTATAGKPVTCNASATGGTAPYTLSWSAPGGSPATGTEVSFTTTYPTKGTFVVNATATDNNGAKKSQTASIVVTGQAIVVTVTCGTATAGQPVTCNASATGGTPPYTFTWSAPGGSPATGSGVSFTTTYPTKGTSLVNATATDTNNAKKSATATVVVAAQPIAVIINASPTVETAGQNTTFSGTVSGGTAPYMFTWNFGDGTPVQPGSPVSHRYGAAGTYSVMLNVTDANAVTTSQSQPYRVFPSPIPSFRVSPIAVVVGRFGNFNATVSGGVAPYTFSWNFGDISVGTGANISHLYSLPGNYSVSLNVTDSNGSTKMVSRFLIVWKNPDVDGDHKVTIEDVAQVALAYGSRLGDPRYDPRLDLDGDGKIDISDVALVALYFGTSGW